MSEDTWMDGWRFHIWTIYRLIFTIFVGNQGKNPTSELDTLVTRARLYVQKAASEITEPITSGFLCSDSRHLREQVSSMNR